jgi:hypothetical protein
VALKATRLGALRGFEVQSQRPGRLDPWNHSRDVVEVHVAAGAQAMEDLLQPCRAALAERGDDDVRGAGTEGLDGKGGVVGGAHPAPQLAQLGEAPGAVRLCVVHCLSPLDKARRIAEAAGEFSLDEIAAAGAFGA